MRCTVCPGEDVGIVESVEMANWRLAMIDCYLILILIDRSPGAREPRLFWLIEWLIGQISNAYTDILYLLRMMFAVTASASPTVLEHLPFHHATHIAHVDQSFKSSTSASFLCYPPAQYDHEKHRKQESTSSTSPKSTTLISAVCRIILMKWFTSCTLVYSHP